MPKAVHDQWKEGQKAFAAFKATWTPERSAEDKKMLRRVLAKARKTPLGKQALAWAHDNGVQFFIDHTCKDAGAYYMPGTPVIGIPHYIEKYNVEFLAEAIVHEIRHAWQDLRGFCYNAHGSKDNRPDFAESFIRLALAEADARAFGKIASAEFISGGPANTPENLQEGFKSWFNKRSLRYYGKHYSRLIGANWGILNVHPLGNDFEFVFHPEKKHFDSDIRHMREIAKRGETFDGGNYFPLLREELREKVLRPSLAQTFYGAATPAQRALTRKIRRASMAAKRKSSTNLNNR
jgi:hypothetical protein